jgi:hypothetical protein
MSKKVKSATAVAYRHEPVYKKTSQDIRRPKLASMNKHKKRNFKAYRGQGKP